ncbi:MAG: hypothetical protein K2O55_06360, partial [Alistipes sp.]|nr:hypothetical protein [Alistipes sp.]
VKGEKYKTFSPLSFCADIYRHPSCNKADRSQYPGITSCTKPPSQNAFRISLSTNDFLLSEMLLLRRACRCFGRNS